MRQTLGSPKAAWGVDWLCLCDATGAGARWWVAARLCKGPHAGSATAGPEGL